MIIVTLLQFVYPLYIISRQYILSNGMITIAVNRKAGEDGKKADEYILRQVSPLTSCYTSGFPDKIRAGYIVNIYKVRRLLHRKFQMYIKIYKIKCLSKKRYDY
jgi:hypothetical protein